MLQKFGTTRYWFKGLFSLSNCSLIDKITSTLLDSSLYLINTLGAVNSLKHGQNSCSQMWSVIQKPFSLKSNKLKEYKLTLSSNNWLFFYPRLYSHCRWYYAFEQNILDFINKLEFLVISWSTKFNASFWCNQFF